MIDLMPIAQSFVATLHEDEVKADKEAVAELTRLSGGDEEVYLNLRNQLGVLINELLHAQLREEADVAQTEVEATEGHSETVINSEAAGSNVETAADTE